MKRKHLYIFFVTGVLFFIDQGLKYVARTHQSVTHYIIEPWLGWEFLANPGVAFGIPVPNTLLIVVTPIIVILLLAWHTQSKRTLLFTTGVALICAGALSNLIDRVIFEYTVDYLRVITSIMNVADLLIVIGAGMIFYT